MDLPRLDGPLLVQLLDGQLVFNDSASWKLEQRARRLAALSEVEREAWLYDVERIEGVEFAEKLRHLIGDVQALGL